MGQLSVTFDSLTPGLKQLAKIGGSPKAVLEAMGTELESITQDTFVTPSLRPVAWPDKKTGGPSNLTNYGVLKRSVAMTELNDKKVTVGLKGIDWPAAVHQFGSADGSTPARPFFPFLGDRITPYGHARIEAIGQKKLDRLLAQAGR